MWRGVVLVLLGFMAGLLINPIHVQGQTPDPCYYLTFTPSPQATHTTVVLPTATQSPSLTPTYDFATHTIFQTATAIKQANLTQEAKWTSSPDFFPTPTQEDFRTPSPIPIPTATLTPVPIPTVSLTRYRILATLGVKVRSGPSLDATIVALYRLGETVLVSETRVIDGYTWGKTNAGWFAIRTPAQVLAELRP